MEPRIHEARTQRAPDGAVAPSLRASLALAVDTLPQAVIVFDDQGHVSAANAAARRLVGRRDDLSFVPAPDRPHDAIRLQARSTRLQRELERAIDRCARRRSGCEAGGADEAGDVQSVRLALQDSHASLILHLSSIAQPDAEDGVPSPAVMGVLVDREQPPSLEPAILNDLFGLTEAESRVAAAYLHCDTVKDVARELGVSVNTVKTHLASAYLKTGCTRQAQLVRLLMALSELSHERETDARSTR
jgi:DNA-binding CsgD family transcriptional regulator